jgi:hypothetical protein
LFFCAPVYPGQSQISNFWNFIPLFHLLVSLSLLLRPTYSQGGLAGNPHAGAQVKQVLVTGEHLRSPYRNIRQDSNVMMPSSRLEVKSHFVCELSSFKITLGKLFMACFPASFKGASASSISRFRPFPHVFAQDASCCCLLSLGYSSYEWLMSDSDISRQVSSALRHNPLSCDLQEISHTSSCP